VRHGDQLQPPIEDAENLVALEVDAFGVLVDPGVTGNMAEAKIAVVGRQRLQMQLDARPMPLAERADRHPAKGLLLAARRRGKGRQRRRPVAGQVHWLILGSYPRIGCAKRHAFAVRTLGARSLPPSNAAAALARHRRPGMRSLYTLRLSVLRFRKIAAPGMPGAVHRLRGLTVRPQRKLGRAPQEAPTAAYVEPSFHSGWS
jgi:hypothetical protein